MMTAMNECELMASAKKDTNQRVLLVLRDYKHGQYIYSPVYSASVPGEFSLRLFLRRKVRTL